MRTKSAFLIVAVALFASVWSCSGDDSSGFETGTDASDSSILNDVTFQPLDAGGN